jgi:hypothetical protein
MFGNEKNCNKSLDCIVSVAFFWHTYTLGMFERAHLEMGPLKESEETEETFFLDLCSIKKQILPYGVFLVKMFSKNVFDTASPKNWKSRS